MFLQNVKIQRGSAGVGKNESVKRIEYIDTLRVIACFLVILTHSTRPVRDASFGIWLAAISFLGSPSSELFLSLSGTVLLPVRKSMRVFYHRRFMKLVPPLFFWSIIILGIRLFQNQISAAQFIESVLFLPLKPAVGVYWFVYAIAGLYLLAPFVSTWLKDCTKKQLEFVLSLWLINMLVPYLNLLPVNATFTNDSHYWILNYFSGFLGYWLLGHYLHVYPIKVGVNAKWIMLCICVIVYVCTLLSIKLSGLDVNPYMDNLQIGSAFLVAVLYTVIQSCPIKVDPIRKIIREIAKYSFGIYLMHVIVVRDIIWRLFQSSTLHPVLDTFMIATLSMIVCYSVIKLIGYLSFSKYVIGI